MVVRDCDNGAALAKLRIAYGEINAEVLDSASILEVANDVINQPKNFTFGTRKLAAQVSLRLEKTTVFDWLRAAAEVDCQNASSLVKIARLWMRTSLNGTMGNSGDEYLFLSGLIQRISKYRVDVESELGSEDFAVLRRLAFFTTLTLSVTRSEDISHLLKAIVKMYSSSSDRIELFELCMNELPLDMGASLLTMSILLSDSARGTFDSQRRHLLTNIRDWAGSQTTSNAAAPLVCALIMADVNDPDVDTVLLECMLHRKKIVRTSIVRCWLARIVALNGTIVLFDRLLMNLRQRWNDIIISENDDCWPPHLWETEDISCIDPQWQWQEAEDVHWIRDRIAAAYLSIHVILAKKYPAKRPTMDDEILTAALCWHLPELRLTAFKLVNSCVKSNEQFEEFLIANVTSSCDELATLVRSAGDRYFFSQDGLVLWKDRRRIAEAEQEEVRQGVYVPDDVSINSLPSDSRTAASRLSYLMTLSGSTPEDSCPSFPRLYATLDSLNINYRAFTKEITELLDVVILFNCDDFTSLDAVICIWDTVTRCRLKAVVDRGCTLLEDLLTRFGALSRHSFDKAIAVLLSQESPARTLAVSRVLWASCFSDSSLFSEFWEKTLPYLTLTTDSTVLSRLLKTLKLFISKTTCEVSDDDLERIFLFCLDSQGAEDFLVRSSATILFGFCVHRFTSSQGVPFFFLAVSKKSLWCKLTARFESLSSMDRRQRILLLTFLSEFQLYHESFYSISDIFHLERLRNELYLVLGESPDVRERRFCIDVILNTLDRGSRDISYLNLQAACEIRYGNRKADLDYLNSRLENFVCGTKALLDNMMPTDLYVSPYVVRVETVISIADTWTVNVNEDEMGAILKRLVDDTKFGHELSAQCAAMVMVQLSKRIGSRCLSNSGADQFRSICIRLLASPLLRVRSLVSRVPAYLKLTNVFLDEYHAERKLLSWCSTSI